MRVLRRMRNSRHIPTIAVRLQRSFAQLSRACHELIMKPTVVLMSTSSQSWLEIDSCGSDALASPRAGQWQGVG
jgi:hypothetical protein